MQPKSMTAAPITKTTTFAEIADALYWLRLHDLAPHDLERAITRACDQPTGATVAEIVNSLVETRGYDPADEDYLRWFIALHANAGTIQHVAGRRFRAAPSPHSDPLDAIVALTPDARILTLRVETAGDDGTTETRVDLDLSRAKTQRSGDALQLDAGHIRIKLGAAALLAALPLLTRHLDADERRHALKAA